LRPHMAGAAVPGRILEGMQIEIDRAAPHDSHLREVAHVLLDDRLPDHGGVVFEPDRDGLAVAGEAVEGEGRTPGVIQLLDKYGAGIGEDDELLGAARCLDSHTREAASYRHNFDTGLGAGGSSTLGQRRQREY